MTRVLPRVLGVVASLALIVGLSSPATAQDSPADRLDRSTSSLLDRPRGDGGEVHAAYATYSYVSLDAFTLPRSGSTTRYVDYATAPYGADWMLGLEIYDGNDELVAAPPYVSNLYGDAELGSIPVRVPASAAPGTWTIVWAYVDSDGIEESDYTFTTVRRAAAAPKPTTPKAKVAVGSRSVKRLGNDDLKVRVVTRARARGKNLARKQVALYVKDGSWVRVGKARPKRNGKAVVRRTIDGTPYEGRRTIKVRACVTKGKVAGKTYRKACSAPKTVRVRG